MVTGFDNAGNGQRNQRPNQISDDIYASQRTLTNYYNRDAFAQPAPGTFGNMRRNSLVGPRYSSVDLSVSRQVRVVPTHTLELRVEAFNVLNTFNWGDPAEGLFGSGAFANLNSRLFGSITTQAGSPRIIQLGVKYTF